VHYGLVAGNGAESQVRSVSLLHQHKQHSPPALLTVIANEIMPGIAENIRILLINRNDSDVRLSGEEVIGGGDLTVIQHV
jgi:hypothetical protein